MTAPEYTPGTPEWIERRVAERAERLAASPGGGSGNMKFRGGWDAGAEDDYDANDVVSHDGGMWISEIDDNASEPGDDASWIVFSASGGGGGGAAQLLKVAHPAEINLGAAGTPTSAPGDDDKAEFTLDDGALVSIYLQLNLWCPTSGDGVVTLAVDGVGIGSLASGNSTPRIVQTDANTNLAYVNGVVAPQPSFGPPKTVALAAGAHTVELLYHGTMGGGKASERRLFVEIAQGAA